MKSKKIDEVQELRNARHTANAVFMKFTEDQDKFFTYAFCFFEGEDGKYYNSRIKKYFNNNFLTYTVGSKKEVVKLLKKIEEDSLYDKVVKMFFVDSDFDESIAELSENLYETPCYSIENFYAQKEVFRDILESEFGVNQAHSDYEKCVSDFDRRFDDFVNGMIEFNALALLRRRKSESNSNVRLGDIKTSQLFDISIYQVVKSENYDENIDKIKVALSVQDIELQECINELKIEGHLFEKFRGKNQLDFVCAILKQLKELSKQGKYFSEKRNKAKLNITSNRLSELSQYALTPDDLEEFLHKHCELLVS